MKIIIPRRAALMLALAIALLFTAVQAQSGGYTLDWWTTDSGGGQASGGAYGLESSIGQADAGKASGGAFSLNSGFQLEIRYGVNMPLVLR